MNKQSFYYLILGIIFFSACKSKVEKIDINDVEAHRTYQNSVIYENNDSSFTGMFLRTKRLIGEYRLLNTKEYQSNSNYHYYLARLYDFVNEPTLKQFWIDTTSNKLKYSEDYKNFYDSVFYFSEKALELDKNNIRAMNILCISMFYEKYRNNYFPEFNLPASFDRDFKAWNNRLNYIVNNASRFINIDTSTDKEFSLGIAEVGLYFLDIEWYTRNYYLNLKDANQLGLADNYGILYTYVSGKKHIIWRDELSNREEDIKKNIYPKVLMARKEIQRVRELERKMQELQERLANISFKHKYYYYDPSTSYSSLIDLYGDSDFTKVSNDGFRFHGTYRIEGDYIYFTYANRSMDINGVIVDADESVAPSKIRYRVTDAGKVELIEKDGSVYIEKDR